MSTWKVILAAVVIFLAGLVTGGVLRHAIGDSAHKPAERRSEDHPMMPWQVREEYVGFLNKELNLSPEQNQRISHLIRDSQQRIKDLYEEINPRIRAELKGVRAAIDEVLDPNQRARFEDLRRHRSKPRAEDAPDKHKQGEGGANGPRAGTSCSMCALPNKQCPTP